MTELEMSITLGLMAEPERNRVKLDPLLQAEILYLKQIFAIAKCQSTEVGRANPDAWAALLPWHSVN
jgi:hypothetical protein